jgi:GH25 family lysozyme M1 (1,4-beta-N-acetylmuramidase)
MAGAGIPALTTTQAAASTQSAAATAREAASTTPTQVDGTDISNQTTVTSWPDIAADNAFVGIMAEQGTGKFIVNTNYASEVNSATSDGMFVMPYIFADPNPNKVATGTDQFNIGWSTISTAPYASGGQDLPVALDMESDPVNFPGEPCYGLTPSAMVTWIQQFVTAAQQKTGLLPIIYTSQSWWNLCTNGSTAFSSDPLWVASYGTSTPAMPTGWSDYAMWQTSGSATVNGVSGPGDTDLLHEPGTIDAAVGGTGSAQVRTLNELAGQTVTYAASGLPTGTSMDSSGLFSWTSATPAGTYQITVTPTVSGGAAPVPSSISFTLNVHGTMTISSVGNQRAWRETRST